MRIRKQVIYPLILVTVWAISVVARLKFNGLAYGFDYGYEPFMVLSMSTLLKLKEN